MSVGGAKPVILILADREEEARAVEETMKHSSQEYDIKVASKDRFARINEIKEADAYVVACDLKAYNQDLSLWKEEIEKYNKNSPLLLVGVNDGSEDLNEMSQEIREFAMDNDLHYFEISNKAGASEQENNAAVISSGVQDLLNPSAKPEETPVVNVKSFNIGSLFSGFGNWLGQMAEKVAQGVAAGVKSFGGFFKRGEESKKDVSDVVPPPVKAEKAKAKTVSDSDPVSDAVFKRGHSATYTPASKALEEEQKEKAAKGVESKVEERKATKPRGNTL